MEVCERGCRKVGGDAGGRAEPLVRAVRPKADGEGAHLPGQAIQDREREHVEMSNIYPMKNPNY